MVATLSMHNVKKWIAEAIEGFANSDLCGVPKPWLIIYEALADYLSNETPIDQQMLWMIENTDDTPADIIFQLQRLKNAIVARMLDAGDTEDLPKLLTWFDQSIVVLTEKVSGKVAKNHSLIEPYETIFFNARDGMYISSLEGRFIQCNEALVEMLGYQSVEALLELDIEHDLYVESRERRVMLDHLERDGFFDHHEFAFNSADGTVKTALESCYRVDVPGGRRFIVGVMVDITAEKEAAQRSDDFVKLLEKSVMDAQLKAKVLRQRCDLLLQAYDHPVVLVEPTSLALIDWNNAFTKRLRFLKRQRPELSLRDLFPPEEWIEVFDQISTSLNRNHFHIVRTQCKSATEEIFPADLSIVDFGDDQGPVLFIEIIDREDQARLKKGLDRMHQNLKHTLDVAPLGVLGFRADGSVALVNRFLLEKMGYSNRNLRRVSFINELFMREEQRLKFNKYIRRFLRGNHVANQEIELRAKDGSALSFFLHTATYHFDDDDKAGFLAFLTPRFGDTENLAPVDTPALQDSLQYFRKTNLQLQTDLATLIRETRDQRGFAETLAKRLKIPIHVIMGYAGLLRRDLENVLSDEQKQDVKIVEEQINFTLGMLETAIEFLQIKGGKILALPELCNVRVMVDELFSRLKERTGETSAQCEWVNDVTSREAQISVDIHLLESLSCHLLDNAVRFSGRGKVRVRATLTEQGLAMTFQDSGPGLDVSELSKLFEPFYQSPTDRGNNGHLGLGLATAKGYLDLIKGGIEVSSKPDVGTTFLIQIPN
ncbi:PAS domain-containing sensor histidine kinase [Acanthopleuribacter pedis]|uniref:histidine kinase n=1 Tax=Acanthopleuribacter pedis TaxID=442870 RepID=A0A8J7QDD1_9BACT|nr:ATP-binding protein [Acanthopleuribacter pedis]MBO1319001.1 PAS domain S-box protein [Acanthopleuribacter pedis]